jgi:hypothetical protein
VVQPEHRAADARRLARGHSSRDRLLSLAVALALALAMLAIACSSGTERAGLSPEEATRLAGPRLDSFARFDEWARRTALGDPAFRSRAALEETAFAPIRHGEEGVADAWIIRRGTEDRILALHDRQGPPAPDRWIDLRTAMPSGIRAARAGELLLLTRTERAPDGAVIDVTVAYAVPP